MKVRQYEKKFMIQISTLGIILVEIIGIIFLWTHKEYTYQKISGIVVKDNLVLLMVTKQEEHLLQKNQKVFIENKNTQIQIEENKGILLKKGKEKYYELIVKVKTYNKKPNETIEFSVKDKKKRMIKILKEIGEGDNYR